MSHIAVFEHDFLPIDESKGFTRRHWELLGKYNDSNNHCYFSLSPNGIKFLQYVGAIQAGDLTIEILPKIGRQSDEDKKKWQVVLLDMLKSCHWVKIHHYGNANLQLKSQHVLDAYIELFIQECEVIVREGMIKKYRKVQENINSFKGKLLLDQQLRTNLVHKERCYAQFQRYDRDNIYNQILLKALKLVPTIIHSPFLIDRVNTLLLCTPELNDIEITADTFRQLQYDRKTTRYQHAMEIAAMILQNYRPDISKGSNYVIAILFDMNDLWEEYIYKQLLQQQSDDISVNRQLSKNFWSAIDKTTTRKIRPDIVITHNHTNTSIILDTKWKNPIGTTPADDDLKQMYIYNEYWNSRKAFLVYPELLFNEQPVIHDGHFHEKTSGVANHGCSMLRVSVLNETSTLDTRLGTRLLNKLTTYFII